MTVIYRPMTHAMRQELRELLRSVPETYAVQLLCEAVSRAIYKWDWPVCPNQKELESLREYKPDFFEQLVCKVLGTGEGQLEEADAANLSHGVRLELYYPATSRLSCKDCQEWWVDPLTGDYVLLEGEKQPRSGGLLCQTQDGCPAGNPTRQRRLSDKNRRAYQHYLECRATGNFPDDPWVRKNASIIRAAMDRVDRECVQSQKGK